jgi:hypothetical protein
VAVRGQLYSRDTSPNTSPLSFVLTRMLTPLRRSSTCGTHKRRAKVH